MRLTTTALALAGLASCAIAHSGVSKRKSLNFGPVHPHAKFHVQPITVSSGFVRADDPFDVASQFVREHLGEQHSSSNSFTIRKDSYTDAATGVTHVYVRQIINGVEVADGDMNINIKDGVVISYGDSFYRGEAPHVAADLAPDVDVHRDYCETLQEELQSRLNVAQQQTHLSDGTTINPLSHLFDSHCTRFSHVVPQSSNDFSASSMDPKRALLQFMVAATPKSEVVEDIMTNYEEHLSKMTSTFEHHFVGDHTTMVEYIENVPDTVNPVKAKPVYIQIPQGDETVLAFSWRFEVEMEDNWYEAAVSMQEPHLIVSVVDWASDAPAPKEPETHPLATYNVWEWGINDPSEGNRSIVKENIDSLASPLGWHVIPQSNDPLASDKAGSAYTNFTVTAGNNVFAHEDWEGLSNWLNNYRPDAGSSMEFDFAYNPQPTDKADALAEAKKYINTTVTQLFYTSNMVHDIFYRYGFDEVSGNFQQHNFGRGGAENDAVIANAQDGSGYNNANFMTPPDGQNGRCRMYLWNTASPYRDGDLEAGIVIHELAHGLSTRLTGGPANSGCLGWGESGGMGEGWGDFLATTIRANRNYSDYPMGAWAANDAKGIRNYPYSLNDTVNPSTYKTLDKPGYWGVHAIGEVWAELLWVLENRLIEKHGYSDTLYPPSPLPNGTIPTGDFYHPRSIDARTGKEKPLVPLHGNTLAVQLVINGMKLQQCRPGFFEARDAIIQADEVLTGGENFCDIWGAFAEKGLGRDARVDGKTPWGGGVRTNGYTVPANCADKVPGAPTPTPGEPDDDDDDDGDDDDWPWFWSIFKA